MNDNQQVLLCENPPESFIQALKKSQRAAVVVIPGGLEGEPPRQPIGPPPLLAVGTEGAAPAVIQTQNRHRLPEALARALEDCLLVFPDAHAGLAWLRYGLGFVGAKQWFCLRTASALLTAGTELSDDLPELATRMGLDFPHLLPEAHWDELFLSGEQAAFAAAVAKAALDLHEPLAGQLESAGLGEVYQLETQVLSVVLEIEAYGLPVNIEILRALTAEASSRLLKLYTEISELHGAPLNPASPSQVLAALLMRGIEIPDTSEKNLLKFSADDLVSRVLACREVERLKREAKALGRLIRPNGRVYPCFNPLGADSRDFTSRSPCLAMFARSPLKRAFEAPPGKMLISAEFDEVEIGAAACLARESKLLDALAGGARPDCFVASLLFGKSLSEVTAEECHPAAKAFLALIESPTIETAAAPAEKKFHKEVLPGQLDKFRGRLFGALPSLAAWHGEMVASAENKEVREARTRLGRRRLLPPTSAASPERRFRALFAHRVHGGIADALKHALLSVAANLPPEASLCTVVTRTILVECPEEQTTEAGEILRSALRQGVEMAFPGLSVPVVIRVGKSWP